MQSKFLILLTASQKDLIREAADRHQVDMAAWARPILVEVAKQQLATR
jgi:hypothetical protein